MIIRGFFIYFNSPIFPKQLSDDGNALIIYETYIFGKVITFSCILHYLLFQTIYIYLLSKFSTNVFTIKYIIKTV